MNDVEWRKRERLKKTGVQAIWKCWSGSYVNMDKSNLSTWQKYKLTISSGNLYLLSFQGQALSHACSNGWVSVGTKSPFTVGRRSSKNCWCNYSSTKFNYFRKYTEAKNKWKIISEELYLLNTDKDKIFRHPKQCR